MISNTHDSRLTGFGALALVGLAAFALSLLQLGQLLGWQSLPELLDAGSFTRVLAWQAWAPRTLMAILLGAGLGIAGCLMQQVLRNPLASPTTMGTAAGAQLALTVAMLLMPSTLEQGRTLVALGGAVLATAVVLLLSMKDRLAPVSVALSGMLVTLYCGALSHALMLLNEQRLASMFLWGAGNLDQYGWQGLARLWPLLAACGVVALALRRPLAMLELGSNGAASLGVPTQWIRLGALGAAVLITALVVGEVGLIGFVGLVTPSLVRLLGPRTFLARLLWCIPVGALLLLIADTAAQLLTPWLGARLIPTGAMTALIGAPVLVWLLRRHSSAFGATREGLQPGRHANWLSWSVVLVLFGATVWLALSWGPAAQGWHWTPWSELEPVWQWRAPRVFSAALAGALLALAGTIIQRLTHNPMASPEILGISSGAAMCLVALLLFWPLAPRLAQLGAAGAGSAAALALLLWLSRQQHMGPHRLLLTGIGLGAAADALVRLLLSGGDAQALALLTWLSGSTYQNIVNEHQWLLAWALACAMAAALMLRWIRLLGLGGEMPQSLGVPMAAARAGVLLVACLAAAGATMVVGPLSFVGLMAPHMAHRWSGRQAGMHLLAAGLFGAWLMILADWAGRTLIYPDQLPAGLLAALLGGVYWLWQWRGQRSGR
ncbi:iron complex transport system permease protein [Halopseudomonas xinjiangensis]|uniref:Iron complex transport system permease protein n=1 Tax=Halopseudomonas xinjiangensis TaxID=487184 RepID=A0A1H1X139_9GAMM|nr:Fe(3+)-hydroxamate ABC transporter permease FhuB [Halopseudomonas xinjiangensis]SDT03077.1 iron complex transport system permease protein [Halopseudomonas xinjiangensis]